MSTRLEDELGRALDARAAQVTGTVELDDVRTRAHQLRQRTRRRWAGGLAAAALVAVAVPAALLLPNGQGATPTDPSPTPTVAPDKLPHPDSGSLDRLPIGAEPAWAYLHDGQVHLPTGGQVTLPGKAIVTSFAGYHGGWLVGSDDGLVQYDGTGAVVRRARSSAIAVSSDGMRTGFQDGSQVLVGIASGMGEGEQAYDVGDAQLVGLLADGPVTNAGTGVQLWSAPTRSRALPGLEVATATSDSAGLVGGYVTPGSGGVLDVSTGTMLWTGGWRPLAFSEDGSLLAAVPAQENGDWTELAILDARTGTVQARADLRQGGMTIRGLPVWEDDTHVLLVADATGSTGREAVLRMGTSSGLERATAVAEGGATTLVPAPYVLAAGRS